MNTLFQDLKELFGTANIGMAISNTDKETTVSIRLNHKDIFLPPITLTGTPEEMDKDLITQVKSVWEQISEDFEEADQYIAKAKTAIEEGKKKAQAQGKKTTPKAPSKPKASQKPKPAPKKTTPKASQKPKPTPKASEGGQSTLFSL
jgi:PRTRC genetic system protein E